MSSIITNNGSMVALQTLKSLNSDMRMVQDQISTGKAVANAKTDASVFAIAATMESDIDSFGSIQDTLSVGKSVTATARVATEEIKDLLVEIKDKVVLAQDGSVDGQKIQDDIDGLKASIDSIVKSSQFNGASLINADAGSGYGNYTVLSSLNRETDGTVTAETEVVTAVDLTLGGGLSGTDGIDVSGGGAAADLTAIEADIQTVIDAAAAFGSSEKTLERQGDFLGKLSDALTSGVGALVDTDMEEASARLTALQTQQQLGVQALSIANSAPQSLLSLFR